MNPDLNHLHPYPFEKLAKLKSGCTPPENLPHIALSIGEPKHPSPHFVTENLIAHTHLLSNYPLTKGTLALRESIAGWLTRRFALTSGVNPETQILPVNGTREALFALAQAVVERSANNPLVLMPNPFYQIYEGAALLAGAKPRYMSCLADKGFLPDLDAVSDAEWSDCQLVYVCSPGNPTGAVMNEAYLQKLINLSLKHNFVIASDECYSEIYFDEAQPPAGLLGAASAMGLHDFKNCLVFHSLSKRSNLPGLRSGFVAGDADIMAKFLLYRTYHGCAMPPATQSASIAAWNDEQHVVDNRDQYRAKFATVIELLSDTLRPVAPDAGFYLWVKTPDSDEQFARDLFAQQHITVLPGQYLSREIDGHNPGYGYVRMALVAPLDECREAALRMKEFLQN